MPYRVDARQWLDNHRYLVLLTVVAAAFIVRLLVRFALGEAYFWTNGYQFYYSMAANVVAGKGFCLPDKCAWWPPLYPLFLTLSVLSGKSFLLVVVPQALLGAGTAYCAYLIGREMFDSRAGLIACAIAAFYPYYLMHDTALQETGMVTFSMAAAIWLLLRARRLNGNWNWLCAGIALGVATLVRASVVPAIAIGLIWCVAWGATGSMSARLRKGAVLALAALAIVGPWLWRNYEVTGVPVLTTETGWVLWVGNNADTFTHYPAGSIDRSAAGALRDMPAADKAKLASLAGDEIASSNLYAHLALRFIRENPWLTVKGALRKVEAGFSWRLNPYRDRLVETAYFIGYVPVAILGILGMVLFRNHPGTILIAMVFFGFICVTAIFWAHTSHRTYLDLYWIVFAASIIERFWAWLSTAPQANLIVSEKST
jgi:4-amino-4-deoxy-L-arabinose transferase-like glycosyltransferase